MIRSTLCLAATVALAAARSVPSDPTLDRHGRIVNGDNADSDDWPWFVSLQGSSGSHFCGGSLVRSDVVMTAAHCVENTRPRDMRVVVGAHNLDNNDDGGTVRQVQSITSHPQYNTRTLVNDIALIKLTQCMPAGYETIPWDTRSESQLFADFAAAGGAHSGLAAIIGLGTLSSGGSMPRILQEARQSVMTHAQCQSAFGDQNIDSTTMICGSTQQPGAGFGDNSGNVDTCQGDSGGPFVTPNPNVAGGWLLTGLTSWGFGCAGSTPGVYARVSNYAGTNGWIEANLASSCGPPPPPTTAAPVTPAPVSPPTTRAPVAPPTTAPPTSDIFQVTSSSPNGACTVTSSGTCFTDGSGKHANNEQCTIRVLQNARLTATSFRTERHFDYLTINQQRFSGRGNGVTGQLVTAGSDIHWHSDGSVTRAGFVVCGAATPPPPTGAVFRVVSTTQTDGAPSCEVSADGRCFTDGIGAHGNNEHCEFEVLQSALLSVVAFDTERGFDFLTVRGTDYSGSGAGLSGTAVSAGDRISWSADFSITYGGFEICV